MHTTRNKLILVGAALAAGFSSLGLHRYMMANYIDAKGLLIAGNLPGRLLMLVGVGFTLTLLLMLWKLGGDGSYADIFPRDPVSGLLMIAAGITLTLSMPGLHWSSLPSAAPVTALVSFWEKFFAGCMTAMPWLAAVSMVTLGLCRISGRKGWFSFGGVICLFYILTLVSNCRLWSADPQLQDYAYQLLAGVLLQRKRLPVDNITITVFTFFSTVILYGGIINMQSFFNTAGIPGSGGLSWETLRILYVSGLPYDISHGLAAALCIFLIGNPMIRKIERIKIKYGIYK